MARLEDVSIDSLRGELEQFDERRPMLRLVAAILYKQGPSVPTIAEWLDVRPATVYSWFERIETCDSIEESIRDQPRPGRPPLMDPDERRDLLEVLQQDPRTAGYEASSWSAELAQEYIAERTGVTYSKRHTRRLLNETTKSE